jgi:hypothetical protein
MYYKEWNKICKELSGYLPNGVSIHYERQITNKFPEIRFSGKTETFYTDPDYNKDVVLSILVGPFDLHNRAEMNLCIEQLMGRLNDLKYDVEKYPGGYIFNDQNTWHIRFKKPLTYLYLTDEEGVI